MYATISYDGNFTYINSLSAVKLSKQYYADNKKANSILTRDSKTSTGLAAS